VKQSEKGIDVPNNVIIKKEESENININHSPEMKEIDIDFGGTKKGDITLRNAIEEYKKNKESKEPEIDIVRA
jgi:hypothetical protein